ncbi:hypothetical protein A3H38_03980 [candidate division WOR-1 bacterium RIFCSPLOWO2_02_FULL_46_20]|uniref:RND efflux pump membrane fusion protein barrel-sandwich domain-containing protein n=2 Tax=Saganbacteria TaxID=1703751 RepID=A0A1F4RC54_UNCSA|nr:MAG: hypothetical protein A3H38_03980 [candidate division WOR-1 bacterium RIFCSPLOWO2_02_FULL_46_20]
MKKSLLGFLILMLGFIMVGCAGNKGEEYKAVKVTLGTIKAEIPSTGIVEPRNRLEIKPPIAGRIDQVLVKEGESVRKGAILAQMSSADRAALLDAARAKGEDEVKRWEDVYKTAPIIAPLNGFIIQRAVEPGQSVTGSDAILVMADKLIVKAQVDETDIGKIRVGQQVVIELDAYAGKEISGRVEHIAYESETVNNVTIYEVDIVPVEVPEFFRAGMSATVNFVLEEKKNVILLPLRAVKKIGNQSYAFVQKKEGQKPEALQVKTGLENTLNVEILDGLTQADNVIVPTAMMIESLTSRFNYRRGPVNPLQKKKTD